jgi:uncharacterized protein
MQRRGATGTLIASHSGHQIGSENELSNPRLISERDPPSPSYLESNIFTRAQLPFLFDPGIFILRSWPVPIYTYTAFENFEVFASGSLNQVVLAVQKRSKENRTARILIFSDSTGKQMDFDSSGSKKNVLARLKIYSALATPTTTGAGRPKLGVIAREISLLPAHWEWLSNQTGGASATIRHLIDEKIKVTSADKNKVKQAQEVTYKFLSAIAGNLPNFEEALRYLYRRDKKKFLELVSDWPKDIVRHSLDLASDVFD